MILKLLLLIGQPSNLLLSVRDDDTVYILAHWIFNANSSRLEPNYIDNGDGYSISELVLRIKLDGLPLDTSCRIKLYICGNTSGSYDRAYIFTRLLGYTHSNIRVSYYTKSISMYNTITRDYVHKYAVDDLNSADVVRASSVREEITYKDIKNCDYIYDHITSNNALSNSIGFITDNKLLVFNTCLSFLLVIYKDRICHSMDSQGHIMSFFKNNFCGYSDLSL